MRVMAWIGLLLAGALLAGCGFSLPQSEIKDQVSVSSPNGEYIADGFHTVAAATVAHDSTVVRLRTKAMSFDDKASTPIFVVDDLGPFDLTWTNDHELIVHCSSSTPPYLHETKWRDVTIRYVLR